MKKLLNVISNWIWLFAIIVSIMDIVVVCQCNPSKNDVIFDYSGIIVGSLSILVMVLVSWNIWSALEVKRDVSKLREEFGELNTKFGLKMKNATEAINRIHIESKKESITTIAQLEDTIADFCLIDLGNIKRAIP